MEVGSHRTLLYRGEHMKQMKRWIITFLLGLVAFWDLVLRLMREV